MTPITPGIAVNDNRTPALNETSPVGMGVSITPQAQQQQAPIDINNLFNGYMDQFKGNTSAENALRTAFNGYNSFSDTAKGVNDLYDYMVSNTSPAFNAFKDINAKLGAQNTGLLNNQLNQAYQWFGPQGEQTQRVQKYYADLAKNIADQNAINVGSAVTDAAASGASAGTVRAARSKANTQANTDLLNAGAKQFEMYDNIYKNLGTYIDNYVKSMAGNNNQYVRDVYDRLLQYKQGAEQARTNAFQNLRTAQLEDNLRKKTTPTGSGVKLTPEQQLLLAQDQANKQAQANQEVFSNIAQAGYSLSPKIK